MNVGLFTFLVDLIMKRRKKDDLSYAWRLSFDTVDPKVISTGEDSEETIREATILLCGIDKVDWYRIANANVNSYYGDDQRFAEFVCTKFVNEKMGTTTLVAKLSGIL